MEMNIIAYGLIVALCLFGIHEVVTAIFYIWLALMTKAAHKAAMKVVETTWFQNHYYYDVEDKKD